MAYKRKSYKRRAPKRTFAKKYKRGTKKPAIKRMIKTALARSVEVKCMQAPLLDKKLKTQDNVLFPDNVIPMGPNQVTLPLTQGTGQGQRLGNIVNTKSLTFRGSLNPTPYDVTLNPTPRPLMVQFIFAYDREDPNDAFIPGSSFFQNGSSSTGFTGTLTDIWRPINSDRYRVFARKTYKLGYSQYAGTTANVAYQGANQASSNNDFKLAHLFNFNLTKWYPKRVKFNDNLSYPMTRNVYCFIQYVDATGGAMVSPYEAAELSYTLEYKFTDA